MTNFIICASCFLLLNFVQNISSTIHMLENQKIESYSRCTSDVDCKPNSFCYGNDHGLAGKCKCLDGFDLYRNATFYDCLKAAKLGEPCTKDFQCAVLAGDLATCNQFNVCECNMELGHAYRDGLCYRNVRLTETCLSDAECRLSEDKVRSCVDGQCACAVNKIPSSDLEHCLVVKTIGQKCQLDDDCSTTPNAVCHAVCKCGPGFAMARNEAECLKAATVFGDPCTENVQCSEYLAESVCQSGKCACSTGSHSFKNSCFKTVYAGDRCQETGQCVIVKELNNNVNCENNFCVCTHGRTDNDAGCNLGPQKGSSAVQFSPILSIMFLHFIVVHFNFD